MSLAGSPQQPALERAAKHIVDLADLLALLRQGLRREKSWQRQLAAHIGDVGNHLDVLRLTVAMEREAAEILTAAQSLHATCRLALASRGGSRVDPATRAAIKRITDLAANVTRDLPQGR